MISKVLLLVLSVISSSVTADELHIVVSGKSIHFGSGKFNENNYGLGFVYEFTERN